MPLTDTPNDTDTDTDFAINRSKAGHSPVKSGDAKGLHLAVPSSGSKQWRCKCRIDDK